MSLIQDIIEAYLDNHYDHSYYFDTHEKSIYMEMDEALTGESGIDWDDEANERRYLPIPKVLSNEVYGWMLEFEMQQTHSKLLRALNSRKPFREFKETAEQLGLLEKWYEYENERALKRIRRWADEMNILEELEKAA
ncbi:UPF0158 family protein [Fictibacillus aquaticus]|uniref:Uncharacterized protein n=1 Tax=Fictibacillus aquaticus TaxID=2021314 RepID=A0A235F7F1_9BACL|nr:UPF0158 family protein [Fictibacillus aquaticus]OYD57152.1 hypothetical protein CGZ90_10665 [Fictibacillus aquaticus]